MSSNEEDCQQSEVPKKRRIQRACDICRRKKTRCNGGNRCSQCISYNLECTYLQGTRKNGMPVRYVEDLENCLKKMEALLHKLCPDGAILNDLDADLDINTERSVKAITPANPMQIATRAIRNLGSPEALLNNPHDDDFVQVKGVPANQTEHSIKSAKNRFFGKSSEAMLVRTALGIKQEYNGRQDGARRLLDAIRPEFWTTCPWEELSSRVEIPSYSFPDDDLLQSLIDLYFNHTNQFLPLLHRPTFERSITAGQHLADSGFGAIVLVVCALGSRYSEDPRVLLDGVTTYHSAGWKWFDQVQVTESFLISPTLYDVQFYCLAVQYLQGCSAAKECWGMIGIGVRMAQDVGAHRRKYNVDEMTVEDEMWKRAFWVLYCLDCVVSSSFGRPCVVHLEDFDIDLPVECDDEFWGHPDPAKRFKQPPNNPCSATAFVVYIKLLHILGSTLRTIYSIKKSKNLLGFVGIQWEQHIVAELDSALNKWVDSIPDYLRWDPNQKDKRFFNQAAWLYCSYYYVQIIVHKPFIPSMGKSSPLSFPSLAICTNAARSCSHIAGIHSRERVRLPQLHITVFISGVVLLLNIWSGKQNGSLTDPAKEMAEVHQCMTILKQHETRWHPAGRLWDILYELASVGDLALPNSTPPYSNPDSPAMPKAEHPTASLLDVRESMHRSSLLTSQSQEGSFYALPVYSEELGRLPVHGQVAFWPQNQSLLNSAYRNHTTAQDITILNVSGSTRPSDPYSSANSTVGGSSFSTDGVTCDSAGLNYFTPLVPELFLSSNPGLGPTSSNLGSHSIGIDLHQMHTAPGETIPDLANAQATIDSDGIAMWSNAPIGFDLNEWDAYISSVSNFMHGQPSN